MYYFIVIMVVMYVNNNYCLRRFVRKVGIFLNDKKDKNIMVFFKF